MAAVAGSKGRIATTCKSDGCKPPNTSFQASLVSRLLSGEITVENAVEEMQPHAILREVGIDTNMTCNLKCRYCYLDDRPVRKGELDASMWMDILTPLAEGKCKLFAFIGKEPLLDETAVEVLHRLNNLRESGLHFRTGMVTNGTQLHRHADRLFDADLSYLDVSLDGLPEVNDSWRGEGVAKTVLRNIASYLEKKPKHDMFVSSVLHQGNHKHVTHFAAYLFEMGLKGFFTSPVLKFTENGDIKHWALNPKELIVAIENLLSFASASRLDSSCQIVIDLPYRYAWQLLADGTVRADSVFEDQYEVPFWQPDATLPLFIKLNVLSYSYWKAVRITHDGTILCNLDMAAHQNYSVGAEKTGCSDAWIQAFPGDAMQKFHRRFFYEHLASASTDQSFLYDRAVDSQCKFQKTVEQEHHITV